jgi:hypothetical protein
MNDPDLDKLIRDTTPPLDFSASFQRDVWSRIAAEQAPSLGGRLQQALTDWALWLSRPAIAVTTIMLMLIAGAGLGGMVSARDSDAASKRAYSASINPILAAHGESHR